MMARPICDNHVIGLVKNNTSKLSWLYVFMDLFGRLSTSLLHIMMPSKGVVDERSIAEDIIGFFSWKLFGI